MISPARIVALGCVGLVACGHGGGGEAERARVAVGYRIVDTDPDEETTRGLILRNDGGTWVSVGEDVIGEDKLVDVLFSSADVAWAHGSDSLLRSANGGRTWEDARPRLPEDLREGPFVFHALAFADEATGYLVVQAATNGGLPTMGPFVWITRNGGETWERGEDLAPVLNETGLAVAVRAGGAELLRHAPTGETGAVVQGFDGNDHPIERLTDVPTGIRDGFDTVGERGWIALTITPGDDFAESRPIILTSERPGAAWTAHTLPEGVGVDFGSLDMCDARVGVAGGSELFPRIRPIVFWTADGGDWRTSAVPAFDGEFSVTDVTCATEEEVWVLTKGGRLEPETAVLRSEDGGRSFTRVDLGLAPGALLLGMATDAAFR